MSFSVNVNNYDWIRTIPVRIIETKEFFLFNVGNLIADRCFSEDLSKSTFSSRKVSRGKLASAKFWRTSPTNFSANCRSSRRMSINRVTSIESNIFVERSNDFLNETIWSKIWTKRKNFVEVRRKPNRSIFSRAKLFTETGCFSNRFRQRRRRNSTNGQRRNSSLEKKFEFFRWKSSTKEFFVEKISEISFYVKIVDEILPDDSVDQDDAEIEVSAAVGGQESMLFASELFQMYSNYANFRKWSFELIEYDKTDIGSSNEVQISQNYGVSYCRRDRWQETSFIMWQNQFCLNWAIPSFLSTSDCTSNTFDIRLYRFARLDAQLWITSVRKQSKRRFRWKYGVKKSCRFSNTRCIDRLRGFCLK